MAVQVGFAAADNMTGLKLLQAGLRRENLALLAIPMVPVQIMLPFMISKHTGGHRPLNVFFKAYPYRYGREHRETCSNAVVSFSHLLFFTKEVDTPRTKLNSFHRYRSTKPGMPVVHRLVTFY